MPNDRAGKCSRCNGTGVEPPICDVCGLPVDMTRSGGVAKSGRIFHDACLRQYEAVYATYGEDR